MSDNCTDSTNEAYQIFWFNYFVSIGYIDSSDFINLYAPYGKCTLSSLWITYLINVVHFFILSSGVLYFLSIPRIVDHSGLWWPFITWISSFVFLLASIILFILLNLYITLFSILIIAFQVSALIILSISIFIIVKVIFEIECRYQRLIFFFIILLLLLQTGCFTGQVLITVHCLFNLKFISTSLDYSYLSAIIAAVGAIISTLLMDHIFMWYRKPQRSARVGLAPMSQQDETDDRSTSNGDRSTTNGDRLTSNGDRSTINGDRSISNADRSTSPVDPVILNYFQRQRKAPLYFIYSNSDQSRHFHIQPTKHRSVGTNSNRIILPNFCGKRKVHNCLSTSEA